MAKRGGGLTGWLRISEKAHSPNNPIPPIFVLAVTAGPDAGQLFTVYAIDTTIGRAIPAGARPGSVRVSDPSVSSQQAVLRVSSGRGELEHLEAATNRTLVNGQPITRRVLAAGDEIQFGHTTLAVRAPQRAPRLVRPEPVVLAPVTSSGSSDTALAAIRSERPGELADGMLTVISGIPDAIGTTFSLYAPKMTIGRSENCDITIAEGTVSRRHCALHWESNEVVLVHHSLVNPTLVNGREITDRCVVSSGDELQIAHQAVLRLELRAAEALSELPAPADPTEPPEEQRAPEPQAPVAVQADPAPPQAIAPQPATELGTPMKAPTAEPSPRSDPSAPAALPTPAPAPSGDLLDIAIVGAGPAGIAAAIQAATRGASHVLLERNTIANTVEKFQKGKWVMDEPPNLSLREELAVGFEAGAREDVLAEWHRAIEASSVSTRIGPENELVSLEGSVGEFVLRLKGGESIRAARLVISIGVQGNLRKFGVPGDELPLVTYQLDDPGAHEGKNIVVVGVGDAGIENALALAENGNNVSIVNRRDEFDRAKARNRTAIENAIKSRQITHFTHANTERFEEGGIVLRTQNGEVRVDADLVIGRLGGIPPRAFLEGMGVEFKSDDRESVPEVSAQYESNVPGLHLVGAVAGYPLIKNCMNQGFEVVEHVLGHEVIPADEAVLREKLGDPETSVSEALARIQGTIPLLASLTGIQLREFLFESEVLRLGAGEFVFQRNDFTNSFFLVLEGTLEVCRPATDNDEDMDVAEYERSELRDPILVGEFFGEAGLISGRRRSSSVAALSDCVLIETPRMTMNRLIRSVEDIRKIVDTVFIQRSLSSLAPEASVEALHQLAESAEIKSFMPGDTLFAEGDEPDGLHLIRRGAVTISQKQDGLDQVIQYTQAGNYVGETSLLAGGRTRSATVSATVLTETVLLATETIVPFIDSHPDLKRRVEQQAREYAVADAQRRAERGKRGTVSFLMSKGAHEATDLLLIDESLCVRCDNCEKACAQTHGGVSRLDREAGATYATKSGGQLHIPTACQHCENPHCMSDCPPDALRRDPDGEVYIKDSCIGCGNCVSNCPYGVIQMATLEDYRPPGLLGSLLFGLGERSKASTSEGGSEKAVKCDLCRNQPDMRDGRDKAACVSSCPTGAIVRVNPRTYIDELLAQP